MREKGERVDEERRRVPRVRDCAIGLVFLMRFCARGKRKRFGACRGARV